MSGCAIYARYSSNLQSAASIEDQVRMARAHAERAGWVVIDVYTDRAISGAHAATRPGLQRMMDDAKAGRFSLVVAEALDRLSRNLKDIATIHETLTHWGVEIETLAEGQVNEMHIGLKGTMNALFLKDLAAKTRRGQLGMVEGGKTPSGLGYGYDVVRKLDGAGEPVTGQRAVNIEQAEVVNRIFSEFAAGMTGRAIADGLNRDKIKSPLGGIWRANTIGGNRARGSGILYNQAYVGRLVWNRVSMVKNPETGKRISRPNPPEQWVVRDAPELRIIDDETWDRVQAIKAKRAMQAPKQRAPKRIFSGLIRCGTCGGTYTIVRKGGYGCLNHREGGPNACDNARTVTVDKLERLVMQGIKEKLLAPERVEEFVHAHHRYAKADQKQAVRDVGALNRRLATNKRKANNLIRMIEDGAAPSNVMERLRELDAEKQDLTAQLTATPLKPKVVKFLPGLAEGYKKSIEGLEVALTLAEPIRSEAMEMIRSVIEKLVVIPGKKRGQYTIELHGTIPELLTLANPENRDLRETLIKVVDGGGKMPSHFSHKVDLNQLVR